jgi:hypothetical protein
MCSTTASLPPPPVNFCNRFCNQTGPHHTQTGSVAPTSLIAGKGGEGEGQLVPAPLLYVWQLC